MYTLRERAQADSCAEAQTKNSGVSARHCGSEREVGVRVRFSPTLSDV